MIHRSGCKDDLDECECGNDRQPPAGYVHLVRDCAGHLRCVDQAHERLITPGRLVTDIDGRAFGVSVVQ
jgi:hypothetical protein